MRGEFPASPTQSELTSSARQDCAAAPLPVPYPPSNMKAKNLMLTKWLCVLWSVGTGYHLHHSEPGHRHHGGECKLVCIRHVSYNPHQGGYISIIYLFSYIFIELSKIHRDVFDT